MTLEIMGVAQSFSIQEVLKNSLNWVQSLGWVGAIAFIGLYSLSAVLFIPGTILTLGAGVVFGVVWGSVYVWIGATIGATFAFLIGRYFARGWVSRKVAADSKFKAIDAAVAKAGFKIVLLTRLSPIFPFVLLNYAFGVTQVSLRDFCLGSVGMIPGTVLYVYIGSLAGIATIGAPNQTAQTAQWVIRILGFFATVAATVYITRVARSALDEISSGEPTHVTTDD